MTVTDLITILTLFVTIQGIFYLYSERSNERLKILLKNKIKKIKKSKLYVDNNYNVFVNVLLELSAYQDLHSSLIMRLSEHAKLSKQNLISSEIGKCDFKLQKCIHEINILSKDSVSRQSSAKALAEQYGDIYTIKLIETCNLQLYNNQDVDLKSNITILRKRLNDNLKFNES